MTFDSNAESSAKRVVDLETKIDAAKKAKEAVVADILSEETFSFQRAMELSGQYIAYILEENFYSHDLEELHLEINPPIPKGHAYLGSSFLPNKVEAEAALFDAQRGDWRKVKTYLRDKFEPDFVNQATAGDPSLMKKYQKAKKFLDLGAVLPDEGAKFVPPSPAWMDPRFNGELEQSSDNS